MATPIKSLIEWIDEINNSIFALQSSELELKMLAQFRAKLVEKLPIEKDFAHQNFIAGRKYMEDYYEEPEKESINFSTFFKNYQ